MVGAVEAVVGGSDVADTLPGADIEEAGSVDGDEDTHRTRDRSCRDYDG